MSFERSRRRYRLLLRLLPRRFRDRFGREMEEAFAHRLAESGRGGRTAVWLAAAWDVLRGSGREHWRAIRGARRRTSPRPVSGAFERWLYDARLAVKLPLREPIFAARIALLIALAVGVTTAMGSVVDELLFRPVPGVEEPARMVALVSGEASASFAYPDLQDLGSIEAFDGLAAYLPVEADVSNAPSARRIHAELVSPEFFSTLGVDPFLGRLELAGGDETVVIGHALWQSELGSDPNAVGRPLRINGRLFTVVGVTPGGFAGVALGPRTDAWIAAAHARLFMPSMGGGVLTRRGWRLFRAVARLADGVTEEQAHAALAVSAARLDEAHPGFDDARDFRVAPFALRGLALDDVGAVRRYARLLIAALVLVLAVACVNVVGLLGIRDLARSRDGAVRVALGAGRWQLVRLRLVECAVLAGAGGALGTALAWWSLPLLARLELPFDARASSAVDARTLTMALAVTGSVSLVFGLASGFASARRAETAGRLGIAGGGRWWRVGGAAVLVQVALSVSLLVGAGLLLRTLSNLTSVERGFSHEGVLTASLQPDLHGYTEESGRALIGEVLQRVTALPGVGVASVSSELPLRSENRRMGVWVEGRGGDADTGVDHSIVAPRYFQTLGIPVRAGRDFLASDGESAPPVVIVNESFARRFWPEADEPSAVGRRISLSSPTGPYIEIVGVVADHRHQSLRVSATPHIYWSLGQVYSLMMSTTKNVLVRTTREPASLAPALRRIVHEIDPELPLQGLASFSAVVADSYRTEKQLSLLLSAFGVVAVILMVLGLYAMLAYALERRTHEVGIRMAIGAGPRDVSRLFLRMGIGIVFSGVSVGLVAAAFSARYLSHLLYDLSPMDPSTWILVALVTLIAGASASFLPARRAARIDPSRAMRYEP